MSHASPRIVCLLTETPICLVPKWTHNGERHSEKLACCSCISVRACILYSLWPAVAQLLLVDFHSDILLISFILFCTMLLAVGR